MTNYLQLVTLLTTQTMLIGSYVDLGQPLNHSPQLTVRSPFILHSILAYLMQKVINYFLVPYTTLSPLLLLLPLNLNEPHQQPLLVEVSPNVGEVGTIFLVVEGGGGNNLPFVNYET